MRDVFKILEQDARTTPERIATMTGLGVEEVRRIIKEAEASRAIVKYKTMVNWERLGERQVWALIEVKVTPERDVGFDAVAERIFRFPEARTVYLVSGAYDLAVIVVARDMYDVAQFVSNKLATIDGVHGTVTHFLLKRYKDDDEILVEQVESRRQPLAP
ncbi:MAG: Lrp/AsnC family transcriptional regulator [SAR202 cluster bacterium]|nr:Lrp/AsnC family transcriptional regulator [SAR202 cluster bacterium]